ncbi:MAG: c-type cytochrome, partial [bacterium]|nr:c-type cytochrome [bacterium]
DCVKCHGDHGEGNAEKFFPVLAGQHDKYMLRQIGDIAEKRRRNANPDMVKIVEQYTPEQQSAVVDYMSRLTWPGSGK